MMVMPFSSKFALTLPQPAFALSGGQAQMLALARAVLSEPKYLLLDEPLLGLSEQPKTKVWNAIQDLRNIDVGILMTGNHDIPLDANIDQLINVTNGHLFEEKINES
jgi:ABC-type branched-subunit amino acid transport system ATPase component